MKDMTIGQKMRWVAATLYGVLCVYQMFINQSIVTGTLERSFRPYTWIYAMLVVLGAAVMCVWLFSGKAVLKDGLRRAVVVATVLIIVFELITFRHQMDMVNYTLFSIFPGLYSQAIWLYLFWIIRLMILVLAAFFVTSSKEGGDAAGKKVVTKEDLFPENADTTVIVEETVVVVEEEKKDEKKDEPTIGI